MCFFVYLIVYRGVHVQSFPIKAREVKGHEAVNNSNDATATIRAKCSEMRIVIFSHSLAFT